MKAFILVIALMSVVFAGPAPVEEADDDVLAYNSSKSIKEILKENTGDFSVDVFQELLTRKDLSHLLYSDVEHMI
mgnify:CR=1 FL=1|jgi:hypothetical protein